MLFYDYLQEFKKSLRMPDTTIPRGRPNLSRSLGSINSLFNNRKRSPGIPVGLPKQNSNISKSVDTLNSKSSESESEETNEDEGDEDNSENSEYPQEKPSPFIAKKYFK